MVIPHPQKSRAVSKWRDVRRLLSHLTLSCTVQIVLGGGRDIYIPGTEQEFSEWQELRLGLETRTLPLAPSLPLSLPSPMWDETLLWPCDCYPLPASLSPSSSPSCTWEVNFWSPKFPARDTSVSCSALS